MVEMSDGLRQGWKLLVVLALTLAAPTARAEEAIAPASPWEVKPLLVGSTIPKVALETSEGLAFDLNAEVAQKRTILVFYRGGW
ncbi:hypothetical protein ACFL6X_00045 [Candidatus Latescibacterota bacterium]